MTSSPCPISRALKAITNASVPLLHPIANGTPIKDAIDS